MRKNLYFKFALFLLIGFFVLHLADLEYQSNFSMLAEEDQGLVISEYYTYKTRFHLLLIPMVFITCIEYIRLKVRPLRKKGISKFLLLGTFIPIVLICIAFTLPLPIKKYTTDNSIYWLNNFWNVIITLSAVLFGLVQIIRIGELISCWLSKNK